MSTGETEQALPSDPSARMTKWRGFDKEEYICVLKIAKLGMCYNGTQALLTSIPSSFRTDAPLGKRSPSFTIMLILAAAAAMCKGMLPSLSNWKNEKERQGKTTEV
jgi:hypothetical protein